MAYQLQLAGTNELVHTKLVPPQLHPQLVARAALLGRLDSGLNCKLTLVSAPAGFGKTTLVRQWLSRQRLENGDWGLEARAAPGAQPLAPRVAWLALDTGDNDPFRFWRYVLAACQTFAPEIGTATYQLLRASVQPDFEAAVTLLLNDLDTLPGQSVLVLEDYHVITTPQIHQQLAFLLEHLPAKLHLVMLTRHDPPLPLARLRAQHYLNELRAEDLQFSLAETHAFLRQALPYELPDDAIAHLSKRTEGWVAGLHLITLSLRHQDVQLSRRALATVSGRHRHLTAYFGAEVLKTQPELIQAFLLQTSVLSRLTAPLCNAVTGRHDSAAILEHLERANLFIVPLDEDGQWYRYHGLFAESVQHVARRRLGEDALSAGLNRASVWYEQQGLLAEAVEAAFGARAFARAAELVERMIGPQHFRELLEYHTLRRWLGALPQPILAQHPKLCLRFAMITLFSADGRSPTTRTQEEQALALAEQSWLSEGNRAGVGAARAARAIMTGEHGDALLAARLAEEALPWIGEHDHNWRAGCLRLIGSAQLLAGAVDQARQSLQAARAQFEAAGNAYGMRATLLALGEASALGAAPRQAAELYRAVHTADGVEPIDKARALLGLARLSYEWDVLPEAERDAQAAYDLGTRLDDAPTQIQAAIVKARILHARGFTAQAQQLLYTLSARVQNPLLLRPLEAVQAQLALARGDMAAAERWNAVASQGRESIPLLQQEREEFVVARMYIAQRDLAAARGILERWRGLAHQAGRAQSVLEALILTALAHAAGADLPAAQEALLAALSLAQPEGYVRVFLDEGEPMAAVLQAVVATAGPNGQGHLARALLGRAIPEHAEAGVSRTSFAGLPINPLSLQELRVLQLLAAGRSNPEIAEALVVSVNTIKTQLKSIYRKLNVTNRVEACMVAQRLELL